MICPACRNEWDVSKSSCPHCGFSTHLPPPPGNIKGPETFWSNSPQSGNPVRASQNDLFSATESAKAIPPLPKRQSGALSETSFSANNVSSPNPLRRVQLDREPSLPERPPSRPLNASPKSASSFSKMPGADTESASPFSKMPEQNTMFQASPSSPPDFSFAPKGSSFSTSQPLLPGIFLRNGRYRLQELLERQDWPSGAFETMWIGRDVQRERPVMICEVVVPDNTSAPMLSLLRTAAMALGSINRHPHITPLKDAFSDQGRGFFIFEPVEGESLLARLRRLQRPLPESEVVAFCLQMISTLELLAKKSPPITHGFIRPEHIYLSYSSAQYILGNFSIIVAGGGTQLFAGANRSHLSPYASPEFTRGIIDGPGDLYSVLATAYHLATGHPPVAANGIIQHAQYFNAALSSHFDAILAKGLQQNPHQRYQHLGELRQSLVALHSQTISGKLVARNSGSLNESLASAFSPQENGKSAFLSGSSIQVSSYPFPIVPKALDEDEEEILLPSPETLPPMRDGNVYLEAGVMLGIILVSLGIITALSHFHV
jgi:serine/threonine protein kinase